MRLQTQVLSVLGPDDFDNAFLSMAKWRAGALSVLADAMFATQRRRLAELAFKSRLPAVFSGSQYVEAGGLMSYGPNLADCELPVEAPTKFELVINLRTAKQIGLTIPSNVLARADRVIK